MNDQPRTSPTDPLAEGGRSTEPTATDQELGRRLGVVLRARAQNVAPPRHEAASRVRAARQAAASRRRRVARPAVVLGLAAVLTVAGVGAAMLMARPPRPSPVPTSSLLARRTSPSPTTGQSPTFSPSPSPLAFPSLVTVTGSFHLLAPAPSVNAIAFGDPLHGWAAADGAILATRDGGATWATVWRGSERVVEIQTLDSLDVWALAQPGYQGGTGPAGSVPDTLLKTFDGGQSWQTTHLAAPLADLQLVADRQAWALTSPGGQMTQRLLRTTDGGATWRAALPGPLAAICFADAQRGWAIGTQVLRTIDHGAHWDTVAHLPLSIGPGSALRCRGGALWLMGLGAPGEAGGAGLAYDLRRSIDGGVTWAPVLSNAAYPRPGGVVAGPDQMGAFDAADGETAFVLGSADGAPAMMASVTRDGGRTWATATFQVPAVYPSAVAAIDGDQAWFGGGLELGAASGLLASTGDGGRTWQERWPFGGPRPVTGLDFVSSTTGFGIGVLGDASAVMRSDDGGRTWRQVGRLLAAPTPSEATNLGQTWSFVDPEDGWAIDGTGVERTTDGGRSWARVDLPAVAAHPYAIDFRDAGSGCLLASDSTNFFHALRTSDGGRSWTEVPGAQDSVAACAWGDAGARLLGSAQQTIVSVKGRFDFGGLVIADPRHAWATQGGEAILRTVDGGRSWQAVAVDPSLLSGWNAMTFATAEDGWILAADNGLLRTEDGGLTWTELP